MYLTELITEQVKNKIRENKGFAVIIAGSDSDREHLDKLVIGMNKYEIPYQARICSAHKDPQRLLEMIRQYDAIPGTLAYVAVAGGTDALSGTISYLSFRPVISCSPDPLNESCLSNPPGSSNAYIRRPENAARFLAQIFSALSDTPYQSLLADEIIAKTNRLAQADQLLDRP